MERKATSCTSGVAIAVGLGIALSGCGKAKPNDPAEARQVRVQAKHHQDACASAGAIDKLKGRLFDAAIARKGGDRTSLDTLADYSLARIEEPVVAGWDPGLDLTRCKGRLILQVPPGAERGLA